MKLKKTLVKRVSSSVTIYITPCLICEKWKSIRKKSYKN